MSDIFICLLFSFLFFIVNWFVLLNKDMTKRSNDFEFIVKEYQLLLLKQELKNFLFTLFFDSSFLNMMSIDWINNNKVFTECKMIKRKNWFVIRRNFLNNCHLQMLTVHLKKYSFLYVFCSFFVFCFCIEKLQVSML